MKTFKIYISFEGVRIETKGTGNNIDEALSKLNKNDLENLILIYEI